MDKAPWFIEPPLWSVDHHDMPWNYELHDEMLEFFEKERPKESDHILRYQALQRAESLIKSLWPCCEVKVFGSFATGLYLPRSSDIDIVIVGSGGTPVMQKLMALGRLLRSSPVARNVQVISRARVPIVKFIESRTLIPFDVRFDDLATELVAVQMIVDVAAESPALAPIYLLLKEFLHVHNLNEVYHTGGLTSYTLFVMLYVYLQLHPYGRQTSPSSACTGLGVLLAGFFHFYGRSLNVYHYGISCSSRQHFFLKTERGFMNYLKPCLLAVEDPLLPSNDIGRNSFNFPNIQAIFSETYEKLISSQGSGSLLSLILPGYSHNNRCR